MPNFEKITNANSPVSFQTNPDLNWSSKQQSSKEFEVRDAPKKKAALIWVFSIRGGGRGSEPIQKFWGTFLCPNNFGILGRKGGG